MPFEGFEGTNQHCEFPLLTVSSSHTSAKSNSECTGFGEIER